MRNKTVSNAKGLANWLDDFVLGLSKSNKTVEASNEETPEELELVSETNEEELETVATININDLEKIVWNDETFRVHFEENGANVINEFGNGVTFLKGLKTIEEVDHALNDKQVVVSSEEVVEEEVITAEEDSEFQEALTAALEDDNEEVLANDELVEEEVLANDELVEEEVLANDETFEDAVPEELLASNNKETETKDEDDKVLSEIIAGFEEIENRLAAIEQSYARNLEFPQDELADQVREEEMKNFTQNADETSKQINEEQNYDLTTPKGRVEISDYRKNAKTEVQPQEVTETEVAEEKEVNEVEENTEVTEENFEKLTGKDEKIFQNGICPETGEELVKSKTAGSFLGIYSPKGKTEYAVNLATGDIFKFKG